MKENILPLIPAGATQLSDILSIETFDEYTTYNCGCLGVFTHHKDDKNSYHMFIGNLIAEGQCKFSKVQKELGIPSSTLRRIVNTYKKKGPSGFYNTNRKGRGATVLTEAVKAKIQLMLDEEMPISDIAESLNIKYDAIRKAISDGRLHKKEKQLRQEIVPVKIKSDRTVEDSMCELGKIISEPATTLFCSSTLPLPLWPSTQGAIIYTSRSTFYLNNVYTPGYLGK